MVEQQQPNTRPTKLNKNGIPPFESLPLRKGDPIWSAWGLYSDTDELGTLNRLTDERVATAARSEIQTGARSVFFIHFIITLKTGLHLIPRKTDYTMDN